MIKFTVSKLEGLESLWALNAFHKILLGVKQLPSYQSETYEQFFSRVEKLTPSEKEQVIREAVIFVDLMKEEIEALARFAKDSNGISFSYANMKSLSFVDIFEIIVAVCVAISQIEIKFLTKDEKKNSKSSQSMSGESFQGTQVALSSGRSISLFMMRFLVGIKSIWSKRF